jgi:hypothetical protein
LIDGGVERQLELGHCDASFPPHDFAGLNFNILTPGKIQGMQSMANMSLLTLKSRRHQHLGTFLTPASGCKPRAPECAAYNVFAPDYRLHLFDEEKE